MVPGEFDQKHTIAPLRMGLKALKVWPSLQRFFKFRIRSIWWDKYSQFQNFVLSLKFIRWSLSFFPKFHCPIILHHDFQHTLYIRVSRQLPPKKTALPLGLGFGSRSRLVLGWGATRWLPPRKIASWLGLGFGLFLG